MPRFSKILMLALALTPAVLSAQSAGDSAATLRQLIRMRWHERIVAQLDLNPDQAAKLQGTEDKFDSLRRPIQRRQVAIAVALNQQMQPGVAADNDVVTKLITEREENRGKLQDLERQEDQEMAGYLTPVQRVRYQRQREMFIRQLVLVRERRQGRALRPARPFR